MKKIFLALVAMMMTMGLVAQCPKQNEVCHKQFEKCQVERANCEKKKMCVYSPETRAMMQVDRLSHIIKDLTGAEREQLLAFYKSLYVKCEKRKETANPMTKEECKKECDAELRKVLGDDRYILYLEAEREMRNKCEKHPRFHGPHGERPMGCQKPCASTCTKK
jgi:hypothetical protein